MYINAFKNANVSLQRLARISLTISGNANNTEIIVLGLWYQKTLSESHQHGYKCTKYKGIIELTTIISLQQVKL